MKASQLLKPKEKKQILLAIQEAELCTSGEIRVHIENHCQPNEIDRAKEVFFSLGMDETEEKNGVLVYIAVKDRCAAIVGDKGIDQVTAANYWDEEVNILLEHFKNNEYTQGITQLITNVGQKLKEHFPYQSDDINELSDEISIYEN